MANLGNYDASNGETMRSGDCLPAGEYIACIVKSEKRDAKNRGNAYINLEFEVQDGDCRGRHFWTMLNLWNDNQQAVDIAQRELNSICHAIGRLRINDTEELHGIPMRVKLGIKEDKQYGPKNVVKGYSSLNSAPASHHASAHNAGGGIESRGAWNRARA